MSDDTDPDAVTGDIMTPGGEPADLTALRRMAYRAESDGLFFKAQRGEVTNQEWLDKITEIRSRYPYPSD